MNGPKAGTWHSNFPKARKKQDVQPKTLEKIRKQNGLKDQKVKKDEKKMEEKKMSEK